MQPAGPQADQGVAGLDSLGAEHLLVADDPDAEPRQVELTLGHDARMFRRLAAEQRAARAPAPLGDAAHDVGDLLGHQPLDGQVVEEEQRLRPVHTTSFAHIATRSIPTVSNRPASRATSSFVPTPSVAAGEDASVAEPEQPRESSDPVRHLGPPGRARPGRRSARRRLRGGLGVDPGAPVGLGPGVGRFGHQDVSSTNFDGSCSPTGDGVLAVEAGPAEGGLRRLRRGDQRVERDVRERVGPHELPDSRRRLAAISSCRVDMSIP